MDYRAQLFIAAMTMLATIVSGLLQAWLRARATPAHALSSGSLRSTASRGSHVLRDAIVMAQIALAVMLLAGSGLLLRSFLHLRAVDSGFDPRGVLVAPVFLDSQAYNTGERTRTYYRTLFERLAAIPGVAAVGGATTVPTSPLGLDFERPVWPEGTSAASSDRLPAAVRMGRRDIFRRSGCGSPMAARSTIATSRRRLESSWSVRRSQGGCGPDNRQSESGWSLITALPAPIHTRS